MRTDFAPRFAVAVGACAVTAMLGSAIAYAVAEPSSPQHTFYACARGTDLKAHSITVDAIPLCPKGQTLVSWNQNGVAGPSGTTGAAGANGQSGLGGPTGATGATGANGQDGAPGPAGPTGATGATGGNGQNGVAGPTGATGAPGATGPSGGPTGPAGPAGAIGATGANGQNGSNGVSGYQLVSKDGTVPHASFLTDFVACPTGKLPVGGNAFATGSSPMVIRVVQSAVVGTSWGVVIQNTDPAVDAPYTAQAVCVGAN